MTATQPGLDTPLVDTAEMVHISSLSLLKVCNFLILAFGMMALTFVLSKLRC
jgi:hypothetical protein